MHKVTFSACEARSRKVSMVTMIAAVFVAIISILLG